MGRFDDDGDFAEIYTRVTKNPGDVRAAFHLRLASLTSSRKSVFGHESIGAAAAYLGAKAYRAASEFQHPLRIGPLVLHGCRW